MNKEQLAAAKRRNTIAQLVESMRAAQRRERQKESSSGCAIVQFRPRQIGPWKGGC